VDITQGRRATSRDRRRSGDGADDARRVDKSGASG
jgi:hypothetical protein